MAEVILEALGIRKSFSELVLDGISLRLERGEILGIVGPNSCGKTTLLRILAGLEGSYEGEVRRNGSLSIVFQEDRLLPWKTLMENICLGLKYAGRRDIERALNYAKRLGISEEDLRSFPRRVSGGTRRKAAIARALALEPEIILMDEPFTGLDFSTIVTLRSSLADLLRERGISAIIVSHQLEDLLTVVDRCLVMTPKPSKIGAELNMRGMGLEERVNSLKDVLMRMVSDHGPQGFPE
jgi:ABC-type nitrate/sulfonate/bicarbonate transport system ATPase subunit